MVDDDLDDEVAKRRRARRAKEAARNRKLLYVVGGVAGLFLLLIVCGCGGLVLVRFTGLGGGGPVGNVARATIGPSPSIEGVKWTHRDMVEFLDSKGVKLTLTSSEGQTLYVAAKGDVRMAQARYGLVREENFFIPVTKFDTVEAARKAAGNLDATRAWQWGAFVFYGDPAKGLNVQFRKVLE